MQAKASNPKNCGFTPPKLVRDAVKTGYNKCLRDPENSYVITINSLYALHIALFSRVGTQKCVRYIYYIRYSHVRYSEFPATTVRMEASILKATRAVYCMSEQAFRIKHNITPILTFLHHSCTAIKSSVKRVLQCVHYAAFN